MLNVRVEYLEFQLEFRRLPVLYSNLKWKSTKQKRCSDVKSVLLARNYFTRLVLRLVSPDFDGNKSS